jgi:ElaB/YqjD/DUF883 family membrane-anchored ribosome-binding protein
MKNRSTTTAQTLKELVNDLQALLADAEKMIGGSVSEHTSEAVGAMRERIVAAQERLGDFYAEARKKVVASAIYTDDTIRANPYQSIAIVAGIALVAGVLLGRRNS